MVEDDFVFVTKSLEVDEENEAVVWAEDNGWIARKMSYIGRRGCPDRLFYGFGTLLLIEMKKPSTRHKKRGGLSSLQEIEFERYAERGVVVHVCYTAAEAIKILKRHMVK